MSALSQEINLGLEVVRFVLSQKKALWDRSNKCKGNKHHDRICCQKGSDVASIKRKPGWDILSVFPIRALD